MARPLGQVDRRKTEAILDAAAELFADRGPGASMLDIARRAGVSKQTVYNRFASKVAIARAIAARRSDAITAPLGSTDDPLAVLTALAQALVTNVASIPGRDGLRGVALFGTVAPDIVQAIYDGGPGASLRKLSTWLRDQDARGLLSIDDPDHAAEMFSGMALGHAHLRSMLGVTDLGTLGVPDHGERVARAFMRAYGPA